MRRWGMVVSAVYACVLLFFVIPVITAVLREHTPFWSQMIDDLQRVYAEWETWIFVLIMLLCQSMLLFLSVDSSHKRFRPRTHIGLTVTISSLLLLLLALEGIVSLLVGISPGFPADVRSQLDRNAFWTVACLVGMWLAWGSIFHFTARKPDSAVKRATNWLMRASVLELLIAVPSHVFARRRHECCAPAVTSFGIATGIAVMLLSFGPGVLLLYKKRIDRHSKPSFAISTDTESSLPGAGSEMIIGVVNGDGGAAEEEAGRLGMGVSSHCVSRHLDVTAHHRRGSCIH
jgi:hypothetical protein